MTHRGVASSRCFHNSQDFRIELPRKTKTTYSFWKRSSGQKVLNIFHWDPVLHGREECRGRISSCQGRNPRCHVHSSDSLRLYPLVCRGSYVDVCRRHRPTWITAVNSKLSWLCRGYFDIFWISCWSETEHVLGIYCPDRVQSSSSVSVLCLHTPPPIRVHFGSGWIISASFN